MILRSVHAIILLASILSSYSMLLILYCISFFAGWNYPIIIYEFSTCIFQQPWRSHDSSIIIRNYFVELYSVVLHHVTVILFCSIFCRSNFIISISLNVCNFTLMFQQPSQNQGLSIHIFLTRKKIHFFLFI